MAHLQVSTIRIKELAKLGPWIIGATGGSGTRAVARIVRRGGLFIGSHLNDSEDALDLAGFSDHWINSFVLRKNSHLTDSTCAEMQRDFCSALENHLANADSTTPWGWKEPRSMYLLPFFHDQFARLKFLHVVRDGRDMAFSSNQNQLRKHGEALLDPETTDWPQPLRSIALWSRINLRTADYAEKYLQGRYLRIRFEDLCTYPVDIIRRIFDFFELHGDAQEIAGIEIRPPNSIGRWQTQDKALLKELHQIAAIALEKFGYLAPKSPPVLKASEIQIRAHLEITPERDRFVEENAHLLATVQYHQQTLTEQDRLISRLMSDQERLVQETAQQQENLAQKEKQLTQLLAERGQLGQEISRQHSMVQNLVQYTRTIEDSLAWMLLVKYRRTLDRLCPDRTQRRKVYNTVKNFCKNLALSRGRAPQLNDAGLLWPTKSGQAAEEKLSLCYVGKCGKQGFGTADQLQKGTLDHDRKGTSEEILQRIIRAWHQMTRTSAELPRAYQVGGEWLPITEKAFQPLITALNDEDSIILDEILKNFFRLFGDYFGQPTDIHSEMNRQFRYERLKVYSSRWIDLYGEASLSEVQSPLIGNPMGFLINEMLFTHVSFVNNHYARRIEDLCSDAESPVICEIGGGWGGFAYHLFNRNRKFKYIDYDLPVVASLAAYYLLSVFPKLRIGLFGEIQDLASPLDEFDIVVLPNDSIRYLKDQSVDVCFNKNGFAEMDETTVREYIIQFERICKRFILHENHTWISGTKNAAYEPTGGFKHWDLSRVEPSPERFQRLYKIAAPFHSDFFGECFEWLYVRR